MIEHRVKLQLRLDDLVAAIDDAERRGQRLRVQALFLEWELLTAELARVTLLDRIQEEHP